MINDNSHASSVIAASMNLSCQLAIVAGALSLRATPRKLCILANKNIFFYYIIYFS